MSPRPMLSPTSDRCGGRSGCHWDVLAEPGCGQHDIAVSHTGTARRCGHRRGRRRHFAHRLLCSVVRGSHEAVAVHTRRYGRGLATVFAFSHPAACFLVPQVRKLWRREVVQWAALRHLQLDLQEPVRLLACHVGWHCSDRLPGTGSLWRYAGGMVALGFTLRTHFWLIVLLCSSHPRAMVARMSYCHPPQTVSDGCLLCPTMEVGFGSGLGTGCGPVVAVCHLILCFAPVQLALCAVHCADDEM
jgi:hypothetical protein